MTLSCVKPSFVKLRNGWISDRSLCYLASGKPVVVQGTGLSSYLPLGEGIFEFSTVDDAAEALATVNADYAKHCRSAREIAETYFDARRTAETILKALPDMRALRVIPQQAEWDTTFFEEFKDPLYHKEGTAEELAPEDFVALYAALSWAL